MTCRPGAVAAHLATIALAVCAGCSPQRYAENADEAAYSIVEQKQKIAIDRTEPFSIDYAPYRPEAEGEPILLNGAPIPVGDQPVRKLTLEECLQVAFRNSRALQDRKENLYAAALALANSRHDWSGLRGLITGDISRSVTERGNEVNSATGQFLLSFEQRLVNGGVLTLAAGLDAASDLLGVDSTTFGSFLSATFTQPLLQGALPGLAYEDLFRLERDVAIEVLAYERFTQTFATRIITDYYRVLQQLDRVANEQANIDRLDSALRRTTVQVQGGEVSRIEQDQTVQNLLNAQSRHASEVQTYRDRLDQFKITLGLPVTASVALSGAELRQINRLGPAPVPFLATEGLDEIAADAADAAAEAFDAEYPDATDEVTRNIRETIVRRAAEAAYDRAHEAAAAEAVERAVAIALHTRPDVLTELAAVRDAWRDVAIAAHGFLPVLDLTLSASVEGQPPRKPFNVRWHRSNRAASLAFDYNLDQTDNRDAYRLAQIAEARALRDYQAFLDGTRLDVVGSYRELLQARQTYDLQKRNVEVAQRRSALAAMQQAEGEASARDVLEAEEDLRNAQNALTNASVSYETTRLAFLASLGMLDVDTQGQFTERAAPFLFASLGERYGSVEDPRP